MILHSIHLENWRCFIEPVTVGPFSERLNILHAPNATGKSTVFEALRRALLDSHRVKSRDLEAVRPWGRVLSPRVVVEFTHGDITYRITKQFLEKASALLERKENGKFVRLHEGNAADEEVRRIFTRNPKGRGLTDFQNWGLAQILWAPQGDLSYTQLTGDVIEDIQSFLDVQVSRGSDEGTEKKIEEVYHRYFTPGGKLKTGRDAPRLVTLQEQLKDLETRYRDALEQQKRFDELTEKLGDLRAEREQLKRRADEINKKLEAARLKAADYRNLVSEKRQRQAKLEALDARYFELRQRIDTFESVKTELQEVRGILSQYEADLPLREKELKDRQAKLNVAKAGLDKIRSRREEIDLQIEKADDALTFLNGQEKVKKLAGMLQDAQRVQKKLGELKRRRSAIVAPDSHVLKDLYKAKQEFAEAHSRAEAFLAVLDFVPLLEGAIEVFEGDTPGEFKVIPGEKITIKGKPNIEIEYKGVAKIKVMGPGASSDQSMDKVGEAEKKIKELTSSFKTDNIDELEKKKEEADRLDRDIFEMETQLKNILNGLSTPEEIQKEYSQLKKVVEGLKRKYPAWEKTPPDIATLKIEAANFKRIYDEELHESESAWDLAQTAFSGAKSALSSLMGKIEELRKRRDTLDVKLSEMVEAWGSFDNMMKELKKLAISVEAAKESLKEMEEKIVFFGEDPTKLVEELEGRLREADELSQKALEEEKSAEGMLTELSALGTYTQLASIEEERAKVKEAIESEQRRMDAIRLLYDTFVQVRSEAISGIVGPVEEIATKTLEKIAGKRLHHVKLGEKFEPSHVKPEVSATPVTLDNVSGGEREQIYLATRLALAEIVAKNERQLAVLDDVLTFTDAGRFARVLEILEEASKKLQLLILTCHPERYQGLNDARFIDLEAIRYPELAHS